MAEREMGGAGVGAVVVDVGGAAGGAGLLDGGEVKMIWNARGWN